MTTYAGARNPNWRGGRTTTPGGYVLVRVGRDHHLADVRGYAYEHRLVAEEKLGRQLRPDEQVHHRNGVKADNRPENLEVTTQAVHAVRHRQSRARRMPGSPNPVVHCACGCGVTFDRFDAAGRPRAFAPGHTGAKVPIPCSCGCGVEFDHIDSKGRRKWYAHGHNRGAVGRGT